MSGRNPWPPPMKRDSKAPARIWLQLGGSDPHGTWCEDQIEDDDTAYIREDRVLPLLEALERALNETEEPPDIFEWQGFAADALAAYREGEE